MTTINVCDMGGSATRLKEVGKEDSVFHKSSKYKEIPAAAVTRMDVENPRDDIKIIKAPWVKLEGRRFLKDGAFSLYTAQVSGTDNQSLKSAQDGTYVNLIHSVCNQILDKDVEGVEEVILGVCIPAGEFYSPTGGDAIKKGLIGGYEVNFPVLSKTVKFDIKPSDVSVSPEGVVALFSLAGTEYMETVKKSRVLVFDCGYRSSDLTLVTNLSADGQSSRSLAVGGITLESLVVAEFEKHGIFASVEDASKAIETGTIPDSQGVKDVGIMVQNAKKILARRLYDGAVQVLNVAGVFKNSVNYFAPVGRCFEVVGKPGDGHYTGDLAAEIRKIWDTQVGILKFDNLEDANLLGQEAGLRVKYKAKLAELQEQTN